jgi:hypothetical protein
MLVGTDLATSTSYHPQTDAQIEIVNKWIEGYLRKYVASKKSTWIKWMLLGEHCYNTTYRMSINMTPFRALYGYDALTFAKLVFKDIRASKAKNRIQDS